MKTKRNPVLALVGAAAFALVFAFFPAARADEEAAEHGEHAGEHAEGEHAEGEHAEGEHEDVPFNWAYGFIGEKDGEEPSLLYRPKGMAPPFLANVLNAAILFGILVSVGRKPLKDALKQRKERLVGAMQDAAKMKAESEKTLAMYEEKLSRLDEEITRIKREMKESADAERARILAEAKERRDRMERDAKILVEQEIKAARETLMKETVASAVSSAAEIIAKQLGAADHDRIAKDFLETIKTAPIQRVGSRS